MTLTYTIWSNANRHEFIIRCGETIIRRSGLIYPTRAAAKRAMVKIIQQAPLITMVEA